MPFPFRRLLLATEHTEFDVGAERVALALAGRSGAALSAVVPMVSNAEYEAVAPAVVERAEHEVASRIARLRADADAAGVAIDVDVRRDDREAWRAIVAQARDVHADLIVIRRRGKRSFLANVMLGEMVGQVVMNAPCSVLLVPRACVLWTTRVVAGVDRSPAGTPVASTAAAVAAADGLPLTIVGAALHDTASERESVRAAIERAASIAREAGAVVETRVAAGKPAEALAAVAAQQDAGLVVVGRRGETPALKRLLLGGTARGIVELANYPVLVAAVGDR